MVVTAVCHSYFICCLKMIVESGMVFTVRVWEGMLLAVRV